MKTVISKPGLNAVVQQVNNNTVSWIGSYNGDSSNRVMGQTFTCPTEGDLDSIDIFPEHVTKNGPVSISVHEFDTSTRTWGPALDNATRNFSKEDTGKWMSFQLKGLHLLRDKSYGFRLTSDSGLIGVGEAAGSYDRLPLIGGQEWMSTPNDLKGKYYSFLSLTFKVALRA